MRRVVLAVALTGACSSSSGGEPSSVYGTWTYVNATGVTRAGLTLSQDGTYTHYELAPVSSSAANAQVDSGTFVLAGGKITMSPAKASCPGPDPAYEFAYSLEGSDLALGPTQEVYRPGDATAAYATVIVGCFDASGSFTAEAIMPVSP
jgi:hypothetical protein